MVGAVVVGLKAVKEGSPAAVHSTLEVYISGPSVLLMRTYCL